jgi:FAD/FMN-containing dehydrogenase
MAIVEELQLGSGGAVFRPGDRGYDAAVNIWNGAITRRPSVVASCATAAGVATALRFAASHDLEVSVRGGGHNYAGSALTEGGLMVDLTPMKAISVDPAAKRARCGGGVRWAELDAGTQAHGLATPGGFVSTTGVAGLTLGGGLGWLSRTAGLSSDNLVGAEVVTVDGTIRRASADDDADLWWAIRGGGGNFGVVTEFEFALHEIGPMVQLGLFLFEPSDGGDMFRFARDYLIGLPDRYGAFLAGLSAPPAPFIPEAMHFTPKYALAVVGFTDDATHAEVLAPIKQALNPSVELVTPIPYVALQQMFDESAPWGGHAYEKAVYLDRLSDAAIDVILEHEARKVAPLSFLPIFVLGGAYARVPDDSSAFGGRRSVGYVVNISGVTFTADGFDAERQWVRDFWSALVPHADGVGSYVNFMAESEEARVRAAYGAKYARLAALKQAYDPANLLHLNANIRPG